MTWRGIIEISGGARSVVLLALAALTSCAPAASASPGDLDPSFNGKGFAVGTTAGSSGFLPVAIQSDGSIVTTESGQDVIAYNSDGTRDTAFGSNGSFVTSGGTVTDIAVDTADRILVTGATDSPTSQERFLYRLTPTGQLDTSFASGGRFIRDGSSFLGPALIAVAPDDGVAFAPGSEEIIRLDSAGAEVQAFGTGGATTVPGSLAIRAIAVRPDSRVLVTASYTVIQLTPTGTRDGSFGVNGIAENGLGYSFLHDLALGADGSVYALGGRCPTEGTASCTGGPVKFSPSGVPDPNFGQRFIGSRTPARGLAVLPDGGLYVSNLDSPAERLDGLGLGTSLTRLGPDGSLVSAFGIGRGRAPAFPNGCAGRATDVAVDQQGRPVITTEACKRLAVVRYAVDSTLPADADADAIPNEFDRCPVLSGATGFRGCPEYKSKLSTRRGTRSLRGRIKSKGGCFADRKVLLQRRLKPGKFKTIATTRTDKDADWDFVSLRGSRPVRARIVQTYGDRSASLFGRFGHCSGAVSPLR